MRSTLTSTRLGFKRHLLWSAFASASRGLRTPSRTLRGRRFPAFGPGGLNESSIGLANYHLGLVTLVPPPPQGMLCLGPVGGLK
jgi:hypothetical protein